MNWLSSSHCKGDISPQVSDDNILTGDFTKCNVTCGTFVICVTEEMTDRIIEYMIFRFHGLVRRPLLTSFSSLS